MKAAPVLFRLASAALLLPPSASSFDPSSSRSLRRTSVTMTEDAKSAETTKGAAEAAKKADDDNPLRTKRFESEHALGDGEGALKYRAVADWTTLRKVNKPVAEMFHTAYFLEPGDATRPITFVFNGGPGAASAYMHMGALGPKRVLLGEHGELPPPPTKVVDNEETWLGFTDLG